MSRSLLASLLLIAPALLMASERSNLRAPIEGPVEAELISVIDGDTLLVRKTPGLQGDHSAGSASVGGASSENGLARIAAI